MSLVFEGMLLAKNSKAYELYHDPKDKNHKILKWHLKEVLAKEKELMERYDKHERKQT